MFTKMAHEAFMKLKQVRRRSWGGATIYIYIHIYATPPIEQGYLDEFLSNSSFEYWNSSFGGGFAPAKFILKSN